MDRIVLRVAVAFIWLWTGLAVFHPYYREVGLRYLEPLGLPTWPMYAACVLEVVLGLWVLLGPTSRWLTAGQVLLIAAFTIILAIEEPRLLVNPCRCCGFTPSAR
jgi:uncharacterized membrane protein YphA (DoxX/SURF4 family)